jgi:uncharacterized SAM-binding protein YcdF (DUF218 family)
MHLAKIAISLLGILILPCIVLSICELNYLRHPILAKMFFVLSKILDFFIAPITWIIILLLLGLIIQKKKVLKKRFLWIGFLLLIILSNPFLADRTMKAWEVNPIAHASIAQPYDVGIVLGGSMRYFDQSVGRVVYSNSVDRLLQALQLYHAGKIKKILLSGGSGFVNYQEWKESGLLADVLLKSGVGKEDLILENNSKNTYENLLMSNEILKKGAYGSRFLLITSGFHMRRSLLCCKKVGIKADPYAVDIRSNTAVVTLDKIILPEADSLSTWDAMIHEWVGIIMYKFMGYI